MQGGSGEEAGAEVRPEHRNGAELGTAYVCADRVDLPVKQRPGRETLGSLFLLHPKHCLPP